MAENLKSESIFSKAFEALKTVVKQFAVQEGAKIPAVQKEIAAQKLKAGKEVLWSSFPVILVAALAFIVIKKF